jgi:FlaA1/EpsC-like NDP-sugar epimerase
VRKTISADWIDYLELLKKNIRVEKHLSTSKKIALAVEETSRLLFLPFIIFVFVRMTELWILFTGLLIFKTIAHLLIIKITQKRLNEPKIFISSLVYDLFISYYKFFYRWYFNRRNRKNKWRNKA